MQVAMQNDRKATRALSGEAMDFEKEGEWGF